MWVFITLGLQFWILMNKCLLLLLNSITCSFGWKPTKLHTFWGSISSAIFMIGLLLVRFSALLRRNGLLFRYPGFPFLSYVLNFNKWNTSHESTILAVLIYSVSMLFLWCCAFFSQISNCGLSLFDCAVAFCSEAEPWKWCLSRWEH